MLQRLGKIDALLNSDLPPERLLTESALQADQLLRLAEGLLPRAEDGAVAEPLFWINAARRMLAAHKTNRAFRPR